MAENTQPFSKFFNLSVPQGIGITKSGSNRTFLIKFSSDGQPQLLEVTLVHTSGKYVIRPDDIKSDHHAAGIFVHTIRVPTGILKPGEIEIRVVGRKNPEHDEAKPDEVMTLTHKLYFSPHIYFKCPSDWRRDQIYIHTWNTTPPQEDTKWPGRQIFRNYEIGWYEGDMKNIRSTNLIFTDGEHQTGSLYFNQTAWYFTDGKWYDRNPERARSAQPLSMQPPQPASDSAISPPSTVPVIPEEIADPVPTEESIASTEKREVMAPRSAPTTQDDAPGDRERADSALPGLPVQDDEAELPMPQPQEANVPVSAESTPSGSPDPLSEPVPTRHEVHGMLIDEVSGRRLDNFIVRGYRVEPGQDTEPVSIDISKGGGLFTVAYAVASRAETPRQLRIEITGQLGQRIHEAKLDIGGDHREPVRIVVPLPTEQPLDPTIESVAEAASFDLPRKLGRWLKRQGISTLRDVRARGGLARLADLPLSSDDPVISVIDAHANLITISSDIRLNARMIQKGYSDSGVIGGDPQGFIASMGEDLNDFEAARLHAAARAQARLLDMTLLGLRADLANGFAKADENSLNFAGNLNFDRASAETVLGLQCGCRDCESAVSPLAYLADLTDYCLDHVTQNTNPISLGFLVDTLHQPLDRLPASCEAMEQRVRQARICIEVLRAYTQTVWSSLPQEQRDRFAQHERDYRLRTYQALLVRIGTSYDEIRTARTATTEQRQAIAERIGIDLEDTRPDKLDRLFLDPGAGAVTETAIEVLFGLVDTTRDPLAPTAAEPLVRAWRLERLRNLWRAQDWPQDPFSDGRAAVIDPDLIGPDDFRRPYAKADSADPDQAFDIWLRRRRWVDQRLTVLQGLTKNWQGQQKPDFAAMLASLYQPVTYGTQRLTAWSNATPVNQFDVLAARLANGVDIMATRERLWDDLHLSTDAFVRLTALRTKDVASEVDSRNQPVTSEEWREIRSILVSAQKATFQAVWLTEERATSILFGPDEFWPSITQPVEGDWPPARTQGLPLIDPDLVSIRDLPDPLAGARAREVWQSRRDRIARLAVDLRSIQENSGIEAALRLAIGHPNPGDPLPGDIDLLARQLSDADGGVREQAQNSINRDLYLLVPQFERMMAIRARAAETDSTRLPTAADWHELSLILAEAQKRKREYPRWVQEENDQVAGFADWAALKIRLPRWRASADARNAWQQALHHRMAPSLIDPDLINPGDIRVPAALSLWGQRASWVETRIKELRDLREAADGVAGADPLDGFQTVVNASLEANDDDLVAVARSRQSGESIQDRLIQLSLTEVSFNRLLGIRELLAASAPVLSAEWEEIYSILVQSEKQRRAAEWRDEERKARITLAPDWFQIPSPPDVFTFPPPPAVELPVWRANASVRREWQDRLQACIDQQATVTSALADTIKRVEATTLPYLRDALIGANQSQPHSFEQTAKLLADRLFIDTKAGGCQITTRIAQAYETLQQLLFSLRNALLTDTYPELALSAPEFDAEWEWLGSYATWRSAMFVFLYPENLLIPTLRRRQTPGFRQFVADLRGTRMTPQRADAAARRYAQYFQDICTLTIDAACMAETRIRQAPSPMDAPLLYVFGRGGATGSSYLSVRAIGHGNGESPDINWERIDILADVRKIVGAVPYDSPSGDRWILLIAKTPNRLLLVRYDLIRRQWAGQPVELDLPPGDAFLFQAAVCLTPLNSNPPRLALRASDGAIYIRSLNREGADWDGDTDWTPVVTASRGRNLRPLERFVQLDGEQLIVCGSQYRVLGSRDDGDWYGVAGRDYLGAMLWPVPAAPGSVPDAFLFSRDSRGALCQRLVLQNSPTDVEFPPSSEKVSRISDTLQWVTGLSLYGRRIDDNTAYNGMTLGRFFRLPQEDDPHIQILPRIITSETIRSLIWLDRAGVYLDRLAARRESEGALLDWNYAENAVRVTLGRIDESEGVPVWVQLSLSEALRGGVLDNRIIYARRFPHLPDSLNIYPTLSSVPPFWNAPFLGVGLPPPFPITLSIMQFEGQTSGNFFVWVSRRLGDAPVDLNYPFQYISIPITPVNINLFDIIAGLDASELQNRRGQIRDAFNANTNPDNRIFLEEAYYFVPLYIALQLAQSGEYTGALDWFRTLYDYSAPVAKRKIYYGLSEEESLGTDYTRAAEWLQDPLNPHAIAGLRARTYSRYTLLSLIRCFLDFADAEFTRDTSESIGRARLIYRRVLDLLETEDLRQRFGDCEDVIGQLPIQIGVATWQPVWSAIRRDIESISNRAQRTEAAERVKAAIMEDAPMAERLAKARSAVERTRSSETISLATVITRRRSQGARGRSALLAQPTLATMRRHSSMADSSDFVAVMERVTGRSRDELIATLPPWLRESDAPDAFGAVQAQSAASALRPETAAFVPGATFTFCIPANPILRALRLRAELNLYKIRNCRNIAGMERTLDPYAAATDTVSGLPVIGAGGNIILPATVDFTPTPYRFSFLLERARQLVGYAQQVETAFLSALERRDAELYNVMKARQDVQLADAGIRLQDLRVKEAQDGVRLSELQRDRAQIQLDHYTGLLNQNQSDNENVALGWMLAAAWLYTGSAVISLIAAGLPSSVGSGGVSSSPQGSVSAIASALSASASGANTWASYWSTLASYERRRQDWQLQQSLAQQDILIGTQQVRIAEDRVRITGQERLIASIQAENARATVDFLSNKFTNAELYDWMSGILERAYSFFLQQATATAKLAQNQLAFERQEIPPPFIQDDYWEASDENAGSGETSPNRRGLTGSVRLLQDLVQLEQHSILVNQRKSQMTKTISLSRLAPAEFQMFRETGVLRFATPMELFDRDFPGHYLRLIWRVNCSVIALIPPDHGIKATLLNSGQSRVVRGDTLFQTVSVLRPPASVDLTSPREASGLFELQPDNAMLFPFEGLGVDTSWEFRLPRPANAFDFSTIFDVLLTIEYTALDSPDYREQILRVLPARLSADRPFSFRQEFPDQWYDLNNPNPTPTSMTVRFTTRRQDFPPNLNDIRIAQLLVYFASTDGTRFEIPVYFRFTEQGSTATAGGTATSIDRMISTRRGNAGSWTSILGKNPVGTWEMVLPDTPAIRSLFSHSDIQDILFVITYSGEPPAWP